MTTPEVLAVGVLVGAAVVLVSSVGGGRVPTSPLVAGGRSASVPRRRRGSGAGQQPVSRGARLVASGSVAVCGYLAIGGLPGALVGLAAAGAVGWWLRRQEPPALRERREQMAAEMPHVVDLYAALLRSGQAPSAAAETIGATVAGPAAEVLAGVARRDAAGLDAYAVWRPLAEHPGTSLLGSSMLRSLESGARVVDVVDRVAEELRRDARAAAAAHARAVGVRATLPLAACFLPALVLIGVVPFVASLVMPLLAGV